MPTPEDLVPATGQTGLSLLALNLPFFDKFKWQGNTGSINPQAERESYGGVDDSETTDFWSNPRIEITGTIRPTSDAQVLKLGAGLLGKTDPADAGNIWDGEVLVVTAANITRTIHGKPAEYEVTLLWRENFSTIGDVGGDADIAAA